MIELKEGAILVADAHYASYRPLFATLIDKIISKEIETRQLLLMGDVFDLLMGPIKSVVKNEEIIINKLNQLSQEIEVIYLEGNHDFQLKTIFPYMKIYPLAVQPVQSLFNDKAGFVAHGDWNEGILYRLYSALIRNKLILKILNFTDIAVKYSISEKFSQKMKEKFLCSDFKGFENYIKRKFKDKKYICDWFIEGHYHQGSNFLVDGMIYHNLDALACNKSYFVVQSSNNVIALSRHTL